MTDTHTTCRCPAECGVCDERGAPATRWALYDARGVLAGTYATRELAEADAYGPRFRGGHTIAARRLVGYRVTWRHTGDPRQMLYALAESEHARSYARAGADNLRRVQAITDVRVWRVYRRRRA